MTSLRRRRFGIWLALMMTILPVAGHGQEPLALKTSQSGISSVLVSKTGDQIVGQVSQLFLTATAAPRPTDFSQLRVNQEAGGEMIGSLKNVRQNFTARHNQWPSGYFFEFGFEQTGKRMDGSSTGLAMAILLDSLFTGQAPDQKICVTGTIAPNGETMPVRSVIPKIKAAQRAEITSMMIPTKNKRALADLVLLEGPAVLYEMTFYSVGSVDDALKILKPDQADEVEAAHRDFRKVVNYMVDHDGSIGAFKDALTQRLRSVRQGIPEHLSADFLLRYVDGTLPKRLSLFSSDKLVYDLFRAANRCYRSDDPEGVEKVLGQLEESERILDEKALGFAHAARDWAQALLEAADAENTESSERWVAISREKSRKLDAERAILAQQPEVQRRLEE